LDWLVGELPAKFRSPLVSIVMGVSRGREVQGFRFKVPAKQGTAKVLNAEDAEVSQRSRRKADADPCGMTNKKWE
jgi:hypothetical protein